MQIEYEKDAAKHIQIQDKPTRIRIPEDKPLPDEVEAIARANESIAESGTIQHDAIHWD